LTDGTSWFAQNKSHTQKTSRVLAKLETNQYKVETRRKDRRVSSFMMCGFLAALDLSAVRLYGDDRPITSSASNHGAPLLLVRADQKPHSKEKSGFS